MQNVEGYQCGEACRVFVELQAVVLEVFPQTLYPLCIVDLICFEKNEENIISKYSFL